MECGAHAWCALRLWSPSFLPQHPTDNLWLMEFISLWGTDKWNFPFWADEKTQELLHCQEADVQSSWNVVAHAQNPDFVFRRNRPVHLNRWGGQFSRLLAAELCASAVVMLDTPSSKVVWRVLATHSIRQFPLHFPSRASPCAITFQVESTSIV